MAVRMPPPENREAPASQTGATPKASDNQTDTSTLVEVSDGSTTKLAESGVTAEFAMARGYETITDKRRLADLKRLYAAKRGSRPRSGVGV
jgi:hypothetical protein